ncbi:hypothetical protein THAOC_09866 [Thalassiosira oceanica]|uniref:Uncharacterized protein n=1 Tax=Thalassiosira oceanica TaxID=159749 RepID=K0SU27_THAOC|nr:hypothetical protein THAOC_09866 [Thalassiosira oceanica]|eukprot:EJK68925.1 hypothetical protein THAOC_09866 [Thalassiosira oceanica]
MLRSKWALRLLSQSYFEHQNWQAYEDECQYVRNEEGAPAIFIHERWEPPMNCQHSNNNEPLILSERIGALILSPNVAKNNTA